MPGKKINFFITSEYFPSISVTGTSCSLMCKHCKGKLLESLIPAMTCAELEKIALSLHKRGVKGLLITGGCDERGRVPVNSLIPALKRIKEQTDLILIAHTGFISKEEATLLKLSGLDGIGFDVVGDMTTAWEVYGISVTEEDYTKSLCSISESDIMIFPHVCVGLYYGELKGEFRALELIKNIKPVSIIITGLMPVAGTPMAHSRPKPSDFEKIITKAIEMFHGTPILLGCAHSSGREREEIEKIALKSGVAGIASPTPGIIKFAEKSGYKINYYGTCCGLVPDERSWIPHHNLYKGWHVP
ncbi:MAG: hypothetical protein J5U19_07545 [Candidatus Methanoperedens sp.]|nr:hypothetical protein [Candidatus Methanoperedens sp.]